jgi:hypothetical protein
MAQWQEFVFPVDGLVIDPNLAIFLFQVRVLLLYY